VKSRECRSPASAVVPERLVMALEMASAVQTPLPLPDMSSPSRSLANRSFIMSISGTRTDKKGKELPVRGKDQEKGKILKAGTGVRSKQREERGAHRRGRRQAWRGTRRRQRPGSGATMRWTRGGRRWRRRSRGSAGWRRWARSSRWRSRTR
jgi:hypothetical protein